MKKINGLIVAFVIAYVLISVLATTYLTKQGQGQESSYKVEINRLMEDIRVSANYEDRMVNGYVYVKEVKFLTMEQAQDTAIFNTFLLSKNGMAYQIEPLVINDAQKGYVRFNYRRQFDTKGLLIRFELILTGVFIIVLVILLYLRQNIIKPFTRFSSVPYELAKGRFKGEIEESKNHCLGKFLWGIGMLKDQLDSSKRKELKLEKEKKMMLLSISHDIKTPLNNIKLYAKALEEQVYTTEEEQLHAAHQIGERTVEIENFVSEIVKTSSEDILNIEVQSGEFYLENLVKLIRASYEGRCALSHLQLSIGEYENKLIKGDMDRAYEVVENIMENAWKYGDGRQISISFYEEDYCQLIRIHNSGEPVSTQDFNHLFDSFFRGSNTEGKDGSGLGLYICQQIMRKMNGEIFAEVKADGMDFVLVFAE